MHLQIEADKVCVCRFVYKPAIYYSATLIFLLNTFSQMSAVDPESERLFLLFKVHLWDKCVFIHFKRSDEHFQILLD